MQNNDFWARITSLYRYHTSPVVVCMQNSVISTRITCLYGSLLSSVVFECKTARITSLSGCQTSPVLLCPQNSRLTPELLVSIGPCPHLWFFHAKQGLLDQNYKSLWVPALICGFWMHNSDFWTRTTSLNGSQISPVVLCMKNSVISKRNTSLYGSQTLPAILCMQNGVPSIRLTSLYESQPSSVFFGCTTATFGPE